MFDFEFDMNVAIVAAVLWLIMSSIMWFVPKAIGSQEYSLFLKILIPVLLLPISYVIVNKVNEG